MSKDEEEQRKQWRDALGLSYLAFLMVAAVALPAWIGSRIDQRLGTSPWFLVAFFFLGALGGFIKVFQEVNRISKDD